MFHVVSPGVRGETKETTLTSNRLSILCTQNPTRFLYSRSLHLCCYVCSFDSKPQHTSSSRGVSGCDAAPFSTSVLKTRNTSKLTRCQSSRRLSIHWTATVTATDARKPIDLALATFCSLRVQFGRQGKQPQAFHIHTRTQSQDATIVFGDATTRYENHRR